MKPKIISMYLPQYHRIPENDKWWGEGFTDWVSTKQAEPLYLGHIQPKEPLNDNYYDLSQKNSIKWQSDLAQEYGIDGWAIYHYWFADSKKLLEKPAEIILENKEITMPFCFAWDNTSWIRTWSKIQGNAWTPQKDAQASTDRESTGVLMKLDYGKEDQWKKHFDYLCPFFEDERYIKYEGKPVFIFFTSFDKERLIKMGEYWNDLAKEHGFPGVYLINRSTPLNRNKLFDATLRYEPVFSGWQKNQIIKSILTKYLPFRSESKLKKYKYDKIWDKIIAGAKKCKDSTCYFGAFVRYDDTPRRGKKGKIVYGETGEKFYKYLSELYSICQKEQKEYLFLTAWNEWGEGAILEPDKVQKFSFLEAVKKVKMEN